MRPIVSPQKSLNGKSLNDPHSQDSKIKIAHIIHSTAVGGGPVIVRTLIRGFNTKEFINILIADQDGPIFDEIERMNIRTLRIALNSKRKFLFSIPRLVRAIKAESADVVILYGQFSGTLGGIAARLAGVHRIIYSAQFPSFVTDFDFSRKLRNHAVEWISCKCAKRVVCISKTDYEQYLRRRMSDISKMVVIHNSFDEEELNNRQEFPSLRLPGGKLIGFIGRLVDQKGVDILIKATARLVKRGLEVHLVVLGDGPDRQELEHLASALGISDSVLFMGFHKDVFNYLRCFDIVAVPSRYEPFGIAAVEAMACGRPVVASRVGGLKEIIEESVTGFLVPPGEDLALMERLRVLIENDALREHMGAQARLVALQKYSAGRMVAAYRKEIHALLHD
ncbi:MAG: glycosyltransferase family 4 protein [Nitrososphaerota archaeon]|nr:glycosyltransferase family 4 protein [Nitrososphaerota archaeon]